MARKSLLRYWGLDKEWTKPNIIEFLRTQKVTPCWHKLYGELYFRPAVFGKETRKKVQTILGIVDRQGVETLKAQLSKKKASK